MERPIYLDNHATTQIDPRVVEAMMPYLTEKYGNPSSKTHTFGCDAQAAVEVAREIIAESINAQSSEIIFTSGATESNNLVLHNRTKILTSAVEHSSVYNICRKKSLDKTGEVLEVRVNRDCEISLGHAKQLSQLMEPEIVSVMLANNEVGTIQPIKELRRLFPNALIHSDMAQALGKIPIDVKDLGVDFASFSAHKVYGPKGIGALYVSARAQDKIQPLMIGGSQEVGLRPGTLNVPAIVGFGKACEIIDLDEEPQRIKRLRSMFFNAFIYKLSVLPDWYGTEDNLPGNLNVAIPVKNMDMFKTIVGQRIIYSFGSACNSGEHPSRILQAMGVPEKDMETSIRLCFGRFNTEEEVQEAADIVCQAIIATNAT